jgi:hypothetical protein
MMEAVSTSETPNVVIEWLTLLLRIWEVPSSNLGSETGYPEFLAFFLCPSRGMPG